MKKKLYTREYYSVFWTSDPERKGEHSGPTADAPCLVMSSRLINISLADGWKFPNVCMNVHYQWLESKPWIENREHFSTSRLQFGHLFAIRLCPGMLKGSWVFKRMLTRYIYISSTTPFSIDTFLIVKGRELNPETLNTNTVHRSQFNY